MNMDFWISGLFIISVLINNKFKELEIQKLYKGRTMRVYLPHLFPATQFTFLEVTNVPVSV